MRLRIVDDETGDVRIRFLTRHGDHDQSDHGNRGGGGYDSIVETYGPTVDEWEPTDGLIATHENGEISVSFENDDGDLEVWGDFSSSEDAQSLAGRVEEFETAATSYDGTTPVSDNGLVDWTVDSGSEFGAPILVGHTPDEEVAIGWPSPGADGDGNDLSGYDMRYLTSDEAQDFSDFLSQAADASDDLRGSVRTEVGSSPLHTLRHGDHDQSDHGPDEDEERGEEGEDDAVARREV